MKKVACKMCGIKHDLKNISKNLKNVIEDKSQKNTKKEIKNG